MFRSSKSIVTALVWLLLLGCSGGERSAQQSFTVTDDRNREIELPKPVARVISLGPSFTEIIYALGAEAKLVGVTTYCDYPAQARLKPKVGDFLNPSTERIIAQEPDCILATSPTQARTVDRLEKLGLKVVELNPESIAGLERCIRLIGQIVARQASADSLIAKLRVSIKQLEQHTSEIGERKTVFVEIDTNPLVSVGSESFVGELIELAGGENIVESGSGYPVVNPEFVIKKNPDVIIIANPAVSVEEVIGRVGWDEVLAVKHARVHRIDAALVSRPGPRAIEGAVELHRLIYPRRPAKGADR